MRSSVIKFLEKRAMQNKKTELRQSRRKLLLLGIGGIASSTLLTGCPLLFVGGTAFGVKTAMDRRSTGTQLEDQKIELKALQDISKAIGTDAHINVTSYNRQVLLTGEVSTEEKKIQAEQVVANMDNVRGVVNELMVGFTTSMGSRSNDTYITSKVKAALTTADGVSAATVKVVTEREVVYLMGILTAREAEVAGDVASGVTGVKQVVRVFDIISEEKLREFEEGIKAPQVKDAGPGSGWEVK